MVNTFVESVGVQPCCQTMNGLVVPRWDLWMSNRGTARDYFESWLHVQMRDSPGDDLTYQVLVFLDRLFMAGLKLHGEDHRDVFTNPEDFLERMLRHEGQLGYTLWDYILHLLIDRYLYIYVCVVFLCGFVGCRESYTITWPPYFLKNIMDVFFVSLRGVSLNPMRYHVEDQKIWLVDESSGWWEEKKPCGVNLKEVFDLLHDVNLKDIMQQWVEPSAPSLQWQ